MIRVEWISADVPGAMDALAAQNITLHDAAVVDALTLRFGIDRTALTAAEALCAKRGDRMRVLGRGGLYWKLRGLRNRPVLLAGLALLLFLVLTIPTRVFFVRVEGNVHVPVNRVLEAAAESGICFGASRREVRSEQMKNRLLEALPELQWAGVNTYGCVAVISVREAKEETVQELPQQVSSIVAATDGIVLSATATEGNLLCKPGQAVSRGQVLISAYTDCGISIRATRAEGEVIARTRHDLTVITPDTAATKGQIREEQVHYSLLVGKNRINLWKGSGIWEGSCGRMYEEYYITLPGGFQLPVALVKETLVFYEVSDLELEQTGAEQLLLDCARSEVTRRMLAGSIESEQTELQRSGGCYWLEGYYLCTEMIGRVRQEQIGDTNGESD